MRQDGLGAMWRFPRPQPGADHHPPPPRLIPTPTLGEDRPLCFLHIAKTGGTSLTEAIAWLYPPDRICSDGGNLSRRYLESLSDRLNGRLFLAGHAGHGVARYLDGRADMITMLRRPADQAVSNYLHVMSEPDNELHTEALRGSFSDYLRRNDHQIDYQARSLAVALGGDPAESDALRLAEVPLNAFLSALPFVGVMERMEMCGEVLSRLLPSAGSIALACLNAAVYRGVSVRTLEGLRQEYENLQSDPQLAPIFAREARVHAKAVERLTRLRRTGSPPRGRWRGFSAPAILGARRFSTAHGRMVGSAILASLKGECVHLIHGPYNVLPQGHYEAEFQFSVQDAGILARGRIQIEAVSNGALCLAKRWLGPGAWASAQTRTLSFTNLDASNVLEFRVRAERFTRGCLVFEGVTLRPSRAWRTWPSVIARIISTGRLALKPSAGS